MTAATLTRDLLTGVAAALSGQIAGDLLYTSGAVGGGIFMKTMGETPDRQLVLNWIPSTDDETLPFGDGVLQLAGRGAKNDPLNVDDILDGAYAILQGLTNQTYGTVHVVKFARYSSIPMGQDQQVRNERVDKYTLTLDYPGTAARPATGY